MENPSPTDGPRAGGSEKSSGGGCERPGRGNEDLERQNAEKTSSVHFLRFEFSSAAKEAVRAGASVKMGCDHTNYPAHVDIAAETLASLAGDLK